MDEIENASKKKAAKVLAIIAMVSVFSAIFLAVAFDIIAFSDVILQFIAALILPIIAFVVLFFAMIVSIIFIFGVLLLEEHGFWPLTLSIQFFKEIIGDIKVTQEAIDKFVLFRIILIVICVTIIVLAIVSKVLNASDQPEYTPEGKKIKKKSGVKAMSTVAIVFAVIGFFVSLAALLITSSI